MQQIDDGVREVKFNPKDHNYFAAGYESGVVEIYDIRMITQKQSSALASNNIHNRSVLSIDWSPQKGSILATSSTDKTIKVIFCELLLRYGTSMISRRK